MKPVSILCNGNRCTAKPFGPSDRFDPPRKVRIILPCADCVRRFGLLRGE